MQVTDHSDRTTSSWLSAIARTAIKLLVGIDAFKSAIKSTPDSRSGIALANNTTPESIDAQLRMDGKNPHEYYAYVDGVLTPVNVDGMSQEEINQHLAAADKAAADPMQATWLWGGLAILGIMALSTRSRGGGGGRRRFGRSRFRSFRPRFHRRRRRR